MLSERVTEHEYVLQCDYLYDYPERALYTRLVPLGSSAKLRALVRFASLCIALPVVLM